MDLSDNQEVLQIMQSILSDEMCLAGKRLAAVFRQMDTYVSVSPFWVFFLTAIFVLVVRKVIKRRKLKEYCVCWTLSSKMSHLLSEQHYGIQTRSMDIQQTVHFRLLRSNTAKKASWGISTFEIVRSFFFPRFCASSSFFFRVESPPPTSFPPLTSTSFR